MARILTVTSGKGGVGKTNLSVNLSVFLSQQGYRTCLFDADLGLANINILLGIYPEYNLEDVIDGRKNLRDIIVRDKNGIDIIPGSSGVAKMEALTTRQLKSLAESFGMLDEYDYLIFDTSAGIAKNVVAFCMNASEVILVITPEPTSLTDAYALMKILYMNGFKQTARVVVNQSKNPKTSQIAFTKLKDTVLKFLGIHLSPLGTIVSDARVIEAVAAQKPFITLYPLTPASKGLKAVALQLIEDSGSTDAVFGLDTFWQKCVDIFTVPLKLPPKKGAETPQKKKSPLPAAAGPVDQPAPTTALPPLDQVQTSPQGDETTKRLLEQLVEKVSEVSKELSGIRSVLEQGAKAGRGSSLPENPEKTADGKPPIIPLDFEAFLAEHESGGRNTG